jgi:hypothetical protein
MAHPCHGWHESVGGQTNNCKPLIYNELHADPATRSGPSLAPSKEFSATPVGAMVQKTASFQTTYEIVEDTEWMKPRASVGVQG